MSLNIFRLVILLTVWFCFPSVYFTHGIISTIVKIIKKIKALELNTLKQRGAKNAIAHDLHNFDSYN